MKVNLQVATQFEATPLIRALKLERNRKPGISHFYQSPDKNRILWISGIGAASIKRTFRAMLTAHPNWPETETWINVGIAGSPNPGVPIGSSFRPTLIENAGDPEAPKYHIGRDEASPIAAKITTWGKPQSIDPSAPPTSLAKNDTIELYDMEAYHWADMLLNCCNVDPVKLLSFKIVSDHATAEKINFREFAPIYDVSVLTLLNTDTFEQAK